MNVTQFDKHLCKYAVINVNALTIIWLSVCLVCTEYNAFSFGFQEYIVFYCPIWDEQNSEKHIMPPHILFFLHHIALICSDYRYILVVEVHAVLSPWKLNLKAETDHMCYPGGSKMLTAPQQHLCIQTVLCSSLKLATLACIQVVLSKQNINKPQTSERRNLGGGGWLCCLSRQPNDYYM